jgi:VanZ family protein
LRRTPITASAESRLARGSPLARILLVVYVLLVAYASLFPLEGWRGVGLSPLAYLSAPWPRYVTAFDIAANLMGYVPYGFLAVAALHPRVRGAAAFALAVASAAVLSLLLEA